MALDGDEGVAFAFGDFTLDPEDERLIGPAGPVRLGGKAYQTLRLLIANPGRLVTRDELFEKVWNGAAVSESSLTSVIKELRRALGDDSREPRYIEGVYGRGYRFVAGVTERARPPIPRAAAQPGRAGGRWRLPAVAAVGLLAILASLAAVWLTRAPPASGRLQIAVEPFAVSGPGLPATFGTDVRDGLIAYSRKGTKASALLVPADRAGAGAYRLAGHVTVEGQVLKAEVRLTAPGADTPVWTADVTGPLPGAEIQIRAIGNGLDCLSIGLMDPGPRPLSAAGLRAWGEYCVQNTARAQSSAAQAEALRATVTLEPKFYTAAARYDGILARESGEGADPAAVELRARAKAVADAAVVLRPDGGEAYLSEALAAAPTDKVAAEAMYSKALVAARPTGFGFEHQYYSRFLLRVGRLQDAARQSQLFLAIVGSNDPDEANILWAQAVRGEYGAARRGSPNWPAPAPAPWALQSQRLRIALWARDWATARDALQSEPDGLERRALAGLIEALASGEPARVHAAGEPFAAMAADPATVSPLVIDALALSGHEDAVDTGALTDDRSQPRQRHAADVRTHPRRRPTHPGVRGARRPTGPGRLLAPVWPSARLLRRRPRAAALRTPPRLTDFPHR